MQCGLRLRPTNPAQRFDATNTLTKKMLTRSNLLLVSPESMMIKRVSCLLHAWMVTITHA